MVWNDSSGRPAAHPRSSWALTGYFAAAVWASDSASFGDFEPVSAGIAELAGSFDEAFPGDPADRIIAATAIVLGLKLVTADARLRRESRVQAVW